MSPSDMATRPAYHDCFVRVLVLEHQLYPVWASKRPLVLKEVLLTLACIERSCTQLKQYITCVNML